MSNQLKPAATLRPELLGNEGYTTIHMRVPKSLHQIEILFLEIYIASLASWPVPQKNSLRGRNRAQRELRLLASSRLASNTLAVPLPSP